MNINSLLHSILVLIYVFIISAISYANVVSFTGPELLGKPTNNSITINIVPDAAIEYYYEYGTTQGGPYTDQTTPFIAMGGQPHEIDITGLATDTRYYYRMIYDGDGDVNDGDFEVRPEYTFHTQRAEGSTFVFTIISDTHAEWNDTDYNQAVANVLADEPDLHLDLGDTQMTDYDANQNQVNEAYLLSRISTNMGGFGHSTPIFLSPGNHENEEGWNIDEGGLFSPAVASIQARKAYFPTPNPNDAPFYSTNTDILSDIDGGTYGDQYREDYYAWEWGDALFIVFDPYQYTMYNPYGNTAGEGAVGETDPVIGDRWNWTLGLDQYNWLKNVLETHKEKKYKFMFAHHMLGGEENYVREGATPAHLFEWGGYNANGTTWGWNTERPLFGDDPIRQLMIDNGVSAFFHGHDHQYAYQVRDGIVYQSMPKPSTGLDFNYYSESDPYTERVIGNAGHLRITVTLTETTVEYVRSNTTGVSHSYTIAPNPISSDPTISITGVPLSVFDSEPGVPTTEQSYTVSGSNLTGDITVTAPTDFEISTSSGSNFGTSVILFESGGSVAVTTIYVRFNRATEGTSNGNISHTSSGAPTQNVAVSGTAAIRNIIYLGDIGTATIMDGGIDVMNLTTTGSVEAGDDIIIVYASDPAANLAVTVTDGAGNSYEEVEVAINQAQVRAHIFAAYNVMSLPIGSTITFTQSNYTTEAPTARAAVVSVFHGLTNSNVLDQSSTGENDASTTASSGTTPATTQAVELLIGGIGTEGPEGDSPGTWQNSFTSGPRTGTTGGSDATSNISASMGWRIVSTTGTYTAEKTGMTNRDHAAAIVTFKGGAMRYSAISSDYTGAGTSLSHPDGDYFTVTVTGGTVSSIHLYRMDEDAGTGTTIDAGYFADPLRYWGVRVFGINPQYTVEYHYQGHPGINNESSLRLATRDDLLDDSWSVVTTEAPVDHTITLTGQTGTEYSFASLIGDNALPVELVSFTAEIINGEVKLNWTTTSELNNAGFILERSIQEPSHFQEIASYLKTETLKGQGTSSSSTEYFYTDKNVNEGSIYHYRLADVQMNGDITYHNTISITTNLLITEFALNTNYPNPFNPGTKIRFSIPNSDRIIKQVSLTIYDALGRKVRNLLDDTIEGGVHELYWDGKNELGSPVSSGIYFYELNSEQFRQIKKMLLVR